MPPDTASTANDNQQESVSYATANDLDFEMSEAEELAFINEQLGTAYATTDTPPANDGEGNSSQDNKDEEAKTPEQKVEEKGEKVEPEAKVETPPVKEEPKVELPTEAKSDDLWIEVDKLVEDEEGNVTTEKVRLTYDPTDPDSFIPDDFRFKNDKQLAQILESKSEMAKLYKERSDEVAEKLKEVEEQQSAITSQEQQLAAWDQEISDLIDAGILTAPSVDPSDPKFLEDPNTQKIDAVFKFMTEQNQARLAEGKNPITSFGTAFTMYNNDIALKEKAEAEKKDNEDAKKKAVLVGGSSSSGTGVTVGYKPGSYSSIYDVPIE